MISPKINNKLKGGTAPLFNAFNIILEKFALPLSRNKFIASPI
jgi:hypothetical protein